MRELYDKGQEKLQKELELSEKEAGFMIEHEEMVRMVKRLNAIGDQIKATREEVDALKLTVIARLDYHGAKLEFAEQLRRELAAYKDATCSRMLSLEERVAQLEAGVEVDNV